VELFDVENVTLKSESEVTQLGH